MKFAVDNGDAVPNIKLSIDDVDDSLGKLILVGVGVGVFSLNMAASCPYAFKFILGGGKIVVGIAFFSIFCVFPLELRK